MTRARTLPVLVDGMGARDESCAHYGGCFDRWAAARGSVTGWAHCPTGCPAHAPRAPRREDARVTSSLAAPVPFVKR